MKRIDREDYGRVYPVPMYESGRVALAKIAEGEVRQIEVKNPRNLKKHNLWMAILGLIVANSDGRWRSKDHLRKSVLIALGLYDLVMGVDGKLFPLPLSMDFDHMDEDDFTEKIFDPSIPILEEVSLIPAEDLLNPDHWEEYL